MTVGTNIEWCDDTANPILGCQGCELWDPDAGVRRCYAGTLHENGKGRKPGHAKFFLIPEAFPGKVLAYAGLPSLIGCDRETKPWLNGAPRSIFISDMGDALSNTVPFAYLEQEILRSVASEAGKLHRWLWLTKQPARMAKFFAWSRTVGWKWPTNLWVGTSVTSEEKSRGRVRDLIHVGGASDQVTRFLSVEPQSKDIDLSAQLASIDWLIQGGESGNQAEPFDIKWARSMQEACRKAKVPYFLKQLGHAVVENGEPRAFKDKKKGGNWFEWPEDLAVREVPGVDKVWSRPRS
jgi:protein gp37